MSLTNEMTLYVGWIRERFPAIRALWLIGSRASGEAGDPAARKRWQLIAFANAATLERMRNAFDLHRPDVNVRVVTDGDRFETAWGGQQSYGSLMQWDWRQTGRAEAYYTEASWAGPAKNADVERTRRKAVALWQSGARVNVPAFS